jgi:hypothetical protein
MRAVMVSLVTIPVACLRSRNARSTSRMIRAVEIVPRARSRSFGLFPSKLPWLLADSYPDAFVERFALGKASR